MGRGVERIGARQFVIAHLGTECAVFAECDRTCAGLDAHRLVDLVELALDGTFECRSSELAQQVVAFEFHARSGVVPRPDQRILGQFAACRLVCGLRRGLFQCFLPVLCRCGAACEQQCRGDGQKGFLHLDFIGIYGLQCFEFLEPYGCRGVRRHTPVAPGRQGHRTDLRPSGIAERLNCCEKKRRKNTSSHFRIAAWS